MPNTKNYSPVENAQRALTPQKAAWLASELQQKKDPYIWKITRDLSERSGDAAQGAGGALNNQICPGHGRELKRTLERVRHGAFSEALNVLEDL